MGQPADYFFSGSYFRSLSPAESFAYATGSQRRLFNEAVSEECSGARTQSEFIRCRTDMEADARRTVMTAMRPSCGRAGGSEKASFC